MGNFPIALSVSVCVISCVFLCVSKNEYITGNKVLLFIGVMFFILGTVLCSFNGKKKALCELPEDSKVTFSGIVVERNGKNENRYRVRTDKVNGIFIRTFIIIDSDCDLFAGCKVIGTGKYKLFMSASNYGQYDQKSYEISSGNTMHLVGVDIIDVIKPVLGIRNGLNVISDHIGNEFDKWLSEDDAGLAKAMVLGDKSDIDKDLRAMYQRNGIAHLIAISGLHIAMFGGTLYQIIRKLTGSYPVAAVIGIIFIILYGVMTGLSGATLRAMIMLIMAVVADVLGRKYDAVTAIATALFIMLLKNPDAYSQAGFLLSFGAVFGISVIYPIIKQYCDFSNDKEDNIIKRGLHNVADGLFVSVSVQLAIIPVILYNYYEIPIYGILLNIIVVPLMAALLFFLVLIGLLGGCVGFAAGLCSFIAGRIFDVYEILCKLAEKLPFNIMHAGRPSVLWVVAYYIILAGALVTMHCKKKSVTGIMLFLMMMMFVIIHLPGRLLINVFDVGQGDGIYIRTPGRSNILVDGGSSTKTNVGTYIIKNGVKYYGAGTIDYIFVTHSDFDHYSGIMELLKDDTVSVKNLVLPDVDFPDEAYYEIVGTAKDKGCNVFFIKSGDRIECNGVIFNCLNPQQSSQGDKNHNSIVLLMKYGSFDMLLTGDIDEAVEDRLICDEMIKEYLKEGKGIEILKVAHHGSDTASSEEFLRIIRPDTAVISVDAHNRYGHPSKKVCERLSKYCRKTYMTKDCGAITIRTDGKKYFVGTYIR